MMKMIRSSDPVDVNDSEDSEEHIFNDVDLLVSMDWFKGTFTGKPHV